LKHLFSQHLVGGSVCHPDNYRDRHPGRAANVKGKIRKGKSLKYQLFLFYPSFGTVVFNFLLSPQSHYMVL